MSTPSFTMAEMAVRIIKVIFCYTASSTQSWGFTPGLQGKLSLHHTLRWAAAESSLQGWESQAQPSMQLGVIAK